ncbi:MAG TPA: VCBS repeat-containing protein, partial [Planctomycetota bacterium]|nr:VCBS repeat-containing protein [Planctomycetota bacterium]
MGLRRVVLLGGLCATAVAQSPAPLFTQAGRDLPPWRRPTYAADVDADGDLDLVDAEGVLENDGFGRFRESATLAWPFQVAAVRAVADFDGDGLSDVIASLPGGALAVFRNMGGAFAPVPATFPPTAPAAPPTAPGGCGGAGRLLAADLDGDGDVDLASDAFHVGPPTPGTACHPSTLWLNAGGFAFVDGATLLPSGAVAAGGRIQEARDVDGDGDVDLLVRLAGAAPGVAVLLNDGFGGFLGTPAFAAGPLLPTPTLADVNGDGFADLVFLIPGPTPADLILPGGPAGFGAGVSTPRPPGVQGKAEPFDLDGDGADELLRGAGAACGLEIVDASPAGAVGPVLYADPDLGPGLTADLDGDGDSDLVAAGQNGDRRLLFGALPWPVVPPLRDPEPGGPWAGCFLADVDSDGDVDVVWRLWSGGAVALAAGLNDGVGRFGTPRLPPTPGVSQALAGPFAAGDFN